MNARDAMPSGGSFSLETSDLREGDPTRPPALRPGAWVRLRVRDSGQGMPEEVRAHLFEPFFTTKPQGVGTGLGLATVYGIVKQSGGEITVDSTPGRGTTFEILLPVVDPVAQGESTPAPSVPGGTEAVLLVEDDPQVRAVIARALRAGGYAVTALENGPAALTAVREGLAPDLLVTDVIMPEMDGRTLAGALVCARPSLRVLFVSGYSRDALSRGSALDPGIALLPKPFTPDLLLTRVRALLDGRGLQAG